MINGSLQKHNQALGYFAPAYPTSSHQAKCHARFGHRFALARWSFILTYKL